MDQAPADRGNRFSSQSPERERSRSRFNSKERLHQELRSKRPLTESLADSSDPEQSPIRKNKQPKADKSLLTPDIVRPGSLFVVPNQQRSGKALTNLQSEGHTNAFSAEVSPVAFDANNVRLTDDIAFGKSAGTTQKDMQAKDPHWQYKKQAGYFLDDQLLPKSKVADYTGNREMQTLSQLSELTHQAFKGSAHGKDKSPVETQYAFDAKNQRLYVSQNTHDSQKALYDAFKDPEFSPSKIVEQGLKGTETRRMAQKLMYLDNQNAHRQQAETGQESTADLQRSLQIRNAFSQGNITVVQNSGERHAEQSISTFSKQQDLSIGDPSGTKTRCASCTLELGPTMHTHGNETVSGILLPAHTDKDPQELRGRHHFMNTSANRPRSTSPVARKRPTTE